MRTQKRKPGISTSRAPELQTAAQNGASRRTQPHHPMPALPGSDFYRSYSAEELARAQGVRPVRRIGQIRGFSDPDPLQAAWFARELRRWRAADRLTAKPR